MLITVISGHLIQIGQLRLAPSPEPRGPPTCTGGAEHPIVRCRRVHAAQRERIRKGTAMTVLTSEFPLVKTVIGLAEAEFRLGVPHPNAERLILRSNPGPSLVEFRDLARLIVPTTPAMHSPMWLHAG